MLTVLRQSFKISYMQTRRLQEAEGPLHHRTEKAAWEGGLRQRPEMKMEGEGGKGREERETHLRLVMRWPDLRCSHA